MKIENKPQSASGEFQVRQKLSLMNRKNLVNGFQFKDDFVFNKEIQAVAALKTDLFINYWQTPLPFDLEPGFSQFICQTGFVRRFEKPGTQLTVNTNRCPNNSFAYITQRVN